MHLPSLTSFKLDQRMCEDDWKHVRKLKLADYVKLSAIDIMIETDFRCERPGEPVTYRTIHNFD